jgi:hypothetical protein
MYMSQLYSCINIKFGLSHSRMGQIPEWDITYILLFSACRYPASNVQLLVLDYYPQLLMVFFFQAGRHTLDELISPNRRHLFNPLFLCLYHLSDITGGLGFLITDDSWMGSTCSPPKPHSS